MAKRPLTSASEIMHRALYAGKPADRIRRLKENMANLALGDKIRAMREREGLTQQQLAELVGTTPSQISRIEDADYDGHTVQTLQRIAGALNTELRIAFVRPRHSEGVQV